MLRVRRLLSKSLKLESPTAAGDTTADIINDFYFFNYAFCKDLGLPANKVSTFLCLMKTVIDADCATPSSESNSMEKSYARFEELLLKHSVERPPYSVGTFNREDVAAIVEHATNHYFRQFKLYKYIFTPKLMTTIKQVGCEGLEVVKGGRHLSDAMAMDLVVTFPEPEVDLEVEEERGGGEEKGEEKEGGDAL